MDGVVSPHAGSVVVCVWGSVVVCVTWGSVVVCGGHGAVWWCVVDMGSVVDMGQCDGHDGV